MKRMLKTPIKRIAVIGGGPSGLAAARALGEEPVNFAAIDLYERQKQLGGLWCYTGLEKTRYSPSVPSTSAKFHNREKTGVSTEYGSYVSPMYEQMETNIVKEIMKYNEYPFPITNETFPTRAEVAEYLQSYAKTISKNVSIHLNTEIVSVKKLIETNEWEVTTRNCLSAAVSTTLYDSVILAHGHFQTPYIPDVKGLKSWSIKEKTSVTHSKFYNHSRDFKDQTVLVVGNSASGVDISLQLTTSAKKVLLSVKEVSGLTDQHNPMVQEIGLIKEYNYENNRSVVTNDGEVFHGIDTVIFCTGYLYDIPFLESYTDDLLNDNGFKINHLFKDIFYILDPSLIFIGIPKLIIPMPFAECQSVLVSRILSGRLKLPSTQEMVNWEKNKSASVASDRDYHNLQFPKDVDYCKDLQEWCSKVEDNKGGHKSETWDNYRTELRGRTGEIKKERLVKVLDHVLRLKEKHQDFYLLRDDSEI